MGVSIKSLFITVYTPNIFLLIFCNFYMFFTFVLVYLPVFACFFVIVQLSVSYGNLDACLRGLQMMRTDSFLNFIFFVIRVKG